MMKPRIYKGTRDFLPQQMVKRNYVINTIQTVFEKYGFEPLETPTLELWDTLAGKFGEEADRLTYRFTDRGDREVGLRYDLTVPLSRVIAQYPQIPKPFKRYQIQPVWRAEKPQKGRFREFYQCDIDVIGSASMLAEAEILASIYEVLQSLGFKDFVIRINSRKILRGIAETSGIGLDKETQLTRAIDKLDKIGHEAVINELISHHIDKKIAHTIIKSLSLKGSNQQRLKKTRELLRQSEGGLAGIQEVEDLTEFLKMYNIPDTYISFDLTLARGLDYYTGPIFEIEVKEPKIGSISGGGRYDKLIGLFSGQDQFATGCSIGLERIIAVMEELDMFPNTLRTGGQVLVTIFDKSCIPHAIKLVNTLRKAGIETDLYTGKAKLRGQIGLANDKNIPIVLIMGPDEINKGQVNIKNMLSGEQKLVALTQLVKKIKAELTSTK
jgi:histidyl-tRNA synthetase